MELGIVRPSPLRAALLIEDNSTWQEILGEQLLKAGFRVDWTGSRSSALAKLEAPVIPYDLIVLDPHLGDDLVPESGEAILDRIVALGLPAHVLLVSGLLDAAALRERFARFSNYVLAYLEKRDFDGRSFREILQAISGIHRLSQALFIPDLPAMRNLLRASEDAVTSVEKGRAFEALVEAMLTAIPLLKCVARNRRTATGELDRVFEVDTVSGTLFQEWGHLVIVECKNWQTRISAAVVARFASLLDHADCRVGLIFTTRGATGRGLKDAHGEVAAVYLRQRRVIIVIDQRDIRSVVEEGANLYEILEEKYRDVRLST